MVHSRPAAACRVAATVTTARTRSPTSSSARCASRAVAPVVSTSSQTTSENGYAGPDQATARRRDARASSRPGWPRAARESSPAWSRDRPAHLEQAGDLRRAAPPAQPPRPRPGRSAASGRARGHARPLGRDGTGTSTVGLGGRGPAAAAAASTRPSGSAEGEHGVLLVGEHHRAQQVVVLPRCEAGGQPVGDTAWAGPTGRWSGGRSAQSRHSERPGAAAAHAAAAVDEVEPGVEHRHHRDALVAAPRTGARRDVPVERARPGGRLGTAAVSGRTSPPPPSSRARPVAVAAQRVEPLVGGDQAQRQVGVGRDHQRRGRAAEDARVGRASGRPVSRRRRRS